MIKTKVIPIEYDEKHQEEAEKLKKLMENNSMLFQIFFAGYKKISFLDIADEETINISSIEDLKYQTSSIVPEYLELLHNQIYQAGGEDIETIFLKMILLDIIASKKDSDIELPSENEMGYNINTIFSIVALDYYKEQNTPEKLQEFIYNPTGEEKKNIFTWLNKRQRYNLLNHLIEEEYRNLLEMEQTDNDTYLLMHLGEVLRLSEINIFDGLIKKDEKPPVITALSKENLDKLCIEFFIQIDPSLKWLKLYNALKRNNKILYGQEFPDPYSKWGCLQTTDDLVIYAPLEGSLRDFMYFIHEFAHFVTLHGTTQDDLLPTSLKEFPSIFFERCATAFLREKGYSEEVILALEQERELATQDNKASVSPTLRYLKQYLTKGPITFETEKQKMDKIRTSLPDDLPEEMKELLHTLMSTQDEDNVHIKIDAENSFLLEHPTVIYDGYPYIVGKYLATKALAKAQGNPFTIFTILNITENLVNETTTGVIQKLGLSTGEFSPKKDASKQYTMKNEN